jgi:hypothetical protein
MTRNWKGTFLLTAILIAAWSTSSEACHRRRSCARTSFCQMESTCGGGYYGGGAGYATANGGYTGGGYQNGYATTNGGYYGGGYQGGGYGYGGRVYNPGGLGGPRSGLGVRPGMGLGGFGPGR